MNFLLKIIEGPMKGAEVALVPGTTVKFGSSDACDIVIADATVPGQAGELDVAEDGVTFVSPDGKSDKLTPFEIRDFGTTAFAIGPAEGKWQEVVRKKVAPPPAEETAPKDDGDKASAPEAAPAAAPTEGAPAGARAAHRKGLGYGIGCLSVVLVLIALGACAWYFWPKIVEKVPKAEPWRVRVVETVKGWKAKVMAPKKPAMPVAKAPDMTLAQLAAAHGLQLSSSPSRLPNLPAVQSLVGNLSKRTERMAIRALALAIDPSVKLDLTDDETMATSANELLFAATDGAIAVKSAKNRALVLTGYAPNPTALTKALKALNTDVPGIVSVDAKEVRVGGTPPPPLAKTSFATIPDKALSDLPTVGRKGPLKVAVKPRRDYPIAGILTVPYPCVVMRNGMRLIEGAVIGTATLVKIEAEKLTFKDGSTTFEWRP